MALIFNFRLKNVQLSQFGFSQADKKKQQRHAY